MIDVKNNDKHKRVNHEKLKVEPYQQYSIASPPLHDEEWRKALEKLKLIKGQKKG